MTQQEIQEIQKQLQEDLLSVIESYGVDEAMEQKDYEAFKTLICQIVIDNIKKLK